MNDIIISVDTEYTDGDLEHGQCMQVAFVSNSTARSGQWVLPITTDAQVNAWVHENLGHMVTGCLKLALTGDPAKQLKRTVASIVDWLIEDKRQAFFLTLEDGRDPSTWDPKLVMLTYCGGYDFGFITLLFNRCGLGSPFQWKNIEIASLASALLNQDWDITGDDIVRELGMEPNRNAHDALADAQYQLEMFRRLEERKSALHHKNIEEE